MKKRPVEQERSSASRPVHSAPAMPNRSGQKLTEKNPASHDYSCDQAGDGREGGLSIGSAPGKSTGISSSWLAPLVRLKRS